MINGGLLRDAVISAAHSISNKKKSVDELNVFQYLTEIQELICQ